MRTDRAVTVADYLWCGVFWTGVLLSVQSTAIWIDSGWYVPLGTGLVLLFGLTILGTMSGCGLAHALRSRGRGGWATVLMVGFALLLLAALPAGLPALFGPDAVGGGLVVPVVLVFGVAAAVVPWIRAGRVVPTVDSRVPTARPRLWDRWEVSLVALFLVMCCQLIASVHRADFGWLTWFNGAVCGFLLWQCLRFVPSRPLSGSYQH